MNHFVEDGRERAIAAVEPTIRAEVAAQFTERLATASTWQRWQIRRAIRAEVRRRVLATAPTRALYFWGGPLE